MSCLHTINRSPEAGLLTSCAPLLRPGDGVLFIEDGTYYCAVPGKIPKLLSGIRLYSLKEDMLARGILEQSSNAIEQVNYSGFVELCGEFDKVISWF